MEFIGFVGLVIMFFLVFNLYARVDKLEHLIRGGSKTALREFEAEPMESNMPNYVRPEPHYERSSDEPSSFDHFKKWLQEDWLLKLGALLLLIGFGWLTSYAFLNNWIGPMGRISLGLVAGGLFIALGWWRIKNFIHQGGIFLVLGSTTILLTVFAAREMYDFFDPLSSLLLMFFSTAFVALASVKYNSRALALSSLILAGIAPLLTNAPHPDYLGLFSYLLVVVLGAIWIVVLTGRRELTTAALLLVTFYSLPFLISFDPADTFLLYFAFAFAAVFFVTNTVGILKLRDRSVIPDLLTAAGNGLFLLTWILVAAPDEWKSLVISVWVIAFSVGAYLLYRVTQKKAVFYIYAGIGVVMLAAATAVELEGAALTIAYTVEATVISILTYALVNNFKVVLNATMLFMVPMALSIESLASRAWFSGVLHKDFFVLIILALTLFGLGLFYLYRGNNVEEREVKQRGGVLLVAGSVYAYALLWLSLGALLFSEDVAVMISLIVYTLVGLVCYFYGLTNEKKGLKVYGGVLLGCVVARLFLVDIWDMALTGRIITFFLIGALLVSTAFLGKKKQASNLSSPQQ